MSGINFSDLVGSYVYIGFNEKLVIAGYEPPGPTKLVFVKITGESEHGLFFEHDKFPLTNKRNGLVTLARTQVFVPFSKISHISSFPDITNFDDYLPADEPVAFVSG